MTAARADFRQRRLPGIEWLATVRGESPVPHRTTGTEDDDDDPGDEHSGENEARERATDERTEAPEEFVIDDQDCADHAEDDDADEEDENTSA